MPDENVAIPAAANVAPTMNSENDLPCDFVAAMYSLLVLKNQRY
jgi:hypothetical protein